MNPAPSSAIDWSPAPDWALAADVAAISATPLSPDRGGYTLTMRECAGSEEVLAALGAERGGGLPGRRLHLGWGSFRNLDIVAARRSDAVVLLDVNLHQLRVWAAVHEALQLAVDATAFVDAVLPRLPTQPRLRQFAADTRRWIEGDLQRPGSWLWLGEPARFDHVRDRFRAGAVLIGTLDLRARAGTQGRFARLAQALQRSTQADGLQLDTVYISNIPWMLAQPTGFFGESHREPMDGDEVPVLARVAENLSTVLGAARWVISAMQLRADATADNLQWQTELLRPQELLGAARWQALDAPPPAA